MKEISFILLLQKESRFGMIKMKRKRGKESEKETKKSWYYNTCYDCHFFRYQYGIEVSISRTTYESSAI